MSNIRILIVDDNEDFSLLLSNYLTTIHEFEIIGIALNGISAINMIKESSPDVVLLDLAMPEIDGLEVLKSTKNNDGTYPLFLVVSAIGTKDIIQQALKLGADEYFLKPVQIESIISKIQGVFDLKTPPNL